jgi:hypothetical protein
LRAACFGQITITVDGINKKLEKSKNDQNSNAARVKMSECFQEIVIECQKGQEHGVIASVHDEEGKVILKTDKSWHCQFENHGYAAAKEITNSHEYTPSTGTVIGDVSIEAIPIKSPDSQAGRAIKCRRKGEYFIHL